jgi:CIC family chloride channel protein
VILANTIAYLIARKFDPVPIFEAFTRQDGLDLPSMEEVREEERLHIEDALDTALEFGAHTSSRDPMQIPVLPASLPLREALSAAEASPHEEGVVVIQLADGSGYALGGAELEALGSAASPETAVGDLLPAERLPLLYPDMPLDGALRHFARWPALLVRNRARVTAVEGVLTQEVVLACFQEQSHG